MAVAVGEVGWVPPVAEALTAASIPVLARARRRSAASRPATVDSMPGGRFPGSWSSTCDRACHGYRTPCATAHRTQMWWRASCSQLWAPPSEPRLRHLPVSISAHQPRKAHSLTCSPVTAYVACSSPRGGGAGGRVSGFWEPGGAGAWYLSWLPITGSRPFRLADLLVQRLRRAKSAH